MIRKATLSKFFYRLNVGRLGGDIIPLGTVALLHDDAGPVSLLVLLGRASLNATELEKMDWTARQVLANPLEYLKREVDQLLKERVGDDLFARLSQKLSWSIYVSPPVEMPVPVEIAAELTKALAPLISAAGGPVGARGVQREGASSRKSRARLPSALARMAGPEFEAGDVMAYVPPAWMVAGVGANGHI